jgi:hypothetical protein
MADLKTKRSLRDQAEEGRYVRGDLTEPRYRKIIAALDTEIAALESQLVNTPGEPEGWQAIREWLETEPGAGGALFKTLYDKYNADRKRALLHQVVTKVTIMPAERRGARFDPKRVKITYI